MDAKYVRECFLYEANTGRLVWKARPFSHFKKLYACKAFNNRFALTEAGCVKSNGYRYVRIDGKDYTAHRLVWLLVHGRWPEQVDHINRIRSDNRLLNLREVSNLENHQNMSEYANNSSGVPGVHWCSTHKKWVAKITIFKKVRRLGYFTNKSDAIAARKSAEEETL